MYCAGDIRSSGGGPGRVESDEYRKDLRRSFELHAPASSLSGSGRWVPYYPGRLYRRGRRIRLKGIREDPQGPPHPLISSAGDETQSQPGQANKVPPGPGHRDQQGQEPGVRERVKGSRQVLASPARPARVAGHPPARVRAERESLYALTRFAYCPGDSFEAGISRFKRVVRWRPLLFNPLFASPRPDQPGGDVAIERGDLARGQLGKGDAGHSRVVGAQ